MDERVRWTDDRLDDFASSVHDDLGEIKAGVAELKSDALRELRGRAERSESQVREVIADYKDDARYAQNRRVAIAVPVGATALGAGLGAILGHLAVHIHF